MSDSQPRVPAGVTTGGQFSTSARAEAAIVLPSADQGADFRDSRAMNELAVMLGRDEVWDGPNDYLADAANLIAATGRPHPGDTNSDYATTLAAWSDANPAPDAGQRRADWATLNYMARHLAASEDWGADEIEMLGESITTSGRPDPGLSMSGREYERALDRFQSTSGLQQDFPPTTRAVAEDAGLPVVHEVLGVVWNRGEVGEERFAAVTPEEADALFRAHIAPAAGAMAEDLTSAEPPEGHDYFDGDEEALLHLDAVCDDAGLKVVGEVLALRLASGDINAADMESLTPELVTSMYERHLGPAIDAIESHLLR